MASKNNNPIARVTASIIKELNPIILIMKSVPEERRDKSGAERNESA
jgi:hypothetical protein